MQNGLRQTEKTRATPTFQSCIWHHHCRRCSRLSPVKSSALEYINDSDYLRWGWSSSRNRQCWSSGTSLSLMRLSRSRGSSSGFPVSQCLAFGSLLRVERQT